jgi:hypothetical protein
LLLQLLHNENDYFVHARTFTLGKTGRTSSKKYAKSGTAIKEFEKRFYQKTNCDWATFMEHLFESTEGYYHPVIDAEEFHDSQELEDEPNIYEQNIELYHIYDPKTLKRNQDEETSDVICDVFPETEVPPEVFANIFEFCDYEMLFQLQLVCKQFNELIDKDDYIWEGHYNNVFDSLFDIPNTEIEFIENWRNFVILCSKYSTVYFHIRRPDLEAYNKLRRNAFIEYKKREIMRATGSDDAPDEETVIAHLPDNATVTFKQMFKNRYIMVRYLNNLLKYLRVELDYKSITTMVEALKALMTSTESFEALKIGAWRAQMKYGHDMQEVIDFLTTNHDQIMQYNPKLNALHLADIHPDRWENSWIQIGDIGQFLATWTNLLHFKCNGSQISFGKTRLVHANLMSITIICGGLPVSVIKSILDADLPNLYHLELLLGTDQYGGNFSVTDFDQLLGSEESGIFPSLQYLGLRNNYIVDSFCKAVAESAILSRIRVLDLSNGTLSDEGAVELLKIEHEQAYFLELMDLHHHYMSDAVVQQFTDKFYVANTTDQEYNNDRYITISE